MDANKKINSKITNGQCLMNKKKNKKDNELKQTMNNKRLVRLCSIV